MTECSKCFYPITMLSFTLSYLYLFQLGRMFNALSLDTNLPRGTLKAHISIIPKEGKDSSSCGSYRPISLLNIDLKLFTKILATQLAQQLQNIIHLELVGFIPSREARDSTTKVFNLIHIASMNHTPCVFPSTDAEKAFDRVNWVFVLGTSTYRSGKYAHMDC